MIKEDSEISLQKYKFFFPIYLTIQITILVQTLLQLHSTMIIYKVLGYKPVDGWFGLWFILFLTGVSMGLILLVFQPYRYTPMDSRRNLVFGYFGGAWVGLVSFIFYFALDPFFYYLTAGLGLIWSVFYVLKRRNNRSQEIFP